MTLRHAAALALAAIVCGCFLPHSEGTHPDTGIVLDKNTKQPISPASVVMSGEWDAWTTTDASGRFVIPRAPLLRWFIIPFGDPACIIVISAPGYKDQEIGGIGHCGFTDFGDVLLERVN